MVPVVHVGTKETGNWSGLGRLSPGSHSEEDGASQENQGAMQRCG